MDSQKLLKLTKDELFTALKEKGVSMEEDASINQLRAALRKVSMAPENVDAIVVVESGTGEKVEETDSKELTLDEIDVELIRLKKLRELYEMRRMTAEALRAVEEADQNIQRSQARNLEICMRRGGTPLNYKAGDFVAIRNVDVTSGTSKKFIPKYRGPYVIDRVLPNDRYVVTDIENCQLTQLPYRGILEAARLKPWVQVRDKTVAFCL